MPQLPLFLDSKKLHCLLVGGGSVAARKLETLIEFGVFCRVVSTVVSERVRKLASEADIQVEVRPFAVHDLAGVSLVVSATNDREVNQHIAAACEARAILVNVVDDRDLSTAMFPATVNRSPVIVSISTGGHSPSLARRLKSMLEVHLSEGLGPLARFIAKRRNELASTNSRYTWDTVIDSAIPNLLERGDEQGAESEYQRLLKQANQPQGLVSLVGAGPGDPALLTLKALRCLTTADTVYYDNLVSTDVLKRARKDAQKIYVGKKRGYKGTRQDEINRMLVSDAQAGKRVVRLKGGDPFLFGRGGEEIELLMREQLPFEVVPGVTAALGCAAYARIPLTHRDYAQSVRFVTGHLKSNEIHLDWPELAKADQTLVVYMGLANLQLFTSNLIENGLGTDVPIAVISRGTYRDQRVIRSTVGAIHSELDQQELVSPTIAIIGQVVDFYSRHQPNVR